MLLCFMSKFYVGSSFDLYFIYILLIIHLYTHLENYSYGCLYYNSYIHFFKPQSILCFFQLKKYQTKN